MFHETNHRVGDPKTLLKGVEMSIRSFNINEQSFKSAERAKKHFNIGLIAFPAFEWQQTKKNY